MNTSRILLTLLIIGFSTLQPLNAQSKLSLMPGIFYNGTGFGDDVNGFGAILGLEYMKNKEHFFSIELRTKYGYYSFDDGTNWSIDNEGDPKPPVNKDEARLEYTLFSPQIGLVPKLYLHTGDAFSFFLENEIAAGWITGRFKYKGTDKKVNITEPFICYNVGVGAEYRLSRYSFVASVAYSTLNFRSKIRKHQPTHSDEWIPNQHAGLLVNLILKVPL